MREPPLLAELSGKLLAHQDIYTENEVPMATLNQSSKPNFEPKETVREMPIRMNEVRQIHDVNYSLIISSVVIAIAMTALAWLLCTNTVNHPQSMDQSPGHLNNREQVELLPSRHI
jgi:hypothetical protein